MNASPRAGKLAEVSMLVNVPRLVTAYYTEEPDPSVPAQRVAFGTSGHRGCAFDKAFNERHILAITQAICLYRKKQGIDGPLFLGMDTHALSVPALASALEVLAANGVEVMLARGDEYTPTPAVSHAILTYNRGRHEAFADGIVITPSHNPPHDGGFKYNPPQWRAGGVRRHRLDRGEGERVPRERPSRGEEDPLREGAPCSDDAPARLSRRLRRRPRQRDRHGRHSRREDPHGRRSARRSRRPLLGSGSPSATD